MQTAKKECKLDLSDACLREFVQLKENLVSTLIIILQDWVQHFEVMCDANGEALGVVLGHMWEKILHLTQYASKAQNVP